MPADWLFNVSCTFDAQGVCITFISRHNNGIVCDTLKTGFFREEAPLLFLLKKRKKYTAVYALSFLNCAKLHPSVCVTVKNYDELCLDFKPARVNQFDCNKNFTHYLILLFHVFLWNKVRLWVFAQHNTKQTPMHSLKLYLFHRQHELSSDIAPVAHLLHCILSGVSLFPHDSLGLNRTSANNVCSFSNFGKICWSQLNKVRFITFVKGSTWVHQRYL